MHLRTIAFAVVLTLLTCASGVRAQCPAAPTNVAAFRAGCSQILSWETTTSPLNFRVFRNTVNDFATATVLTVTAGSARSYTDTTVTTNTTYYYWVRAVNLPNLSCGTGLSPVAGPATGAAISGPGAPGNLQANTTCTTLTGSWSASAGATSYRYVAEAPLGNVIGDYTITGTSFTQFISTPVLPILRLTVTPINACGPGTPSSVTITPTTPGYPPTNFVASTEEVCYVRLTWTPDPRHFNGYRIQRHPTCTTAGPPVILNVPAGASSFIDGTLPDYNCYYWYSITAINPCGTETPVEYEPAVHAWEPWWVGGIGSASVPIGRYVKLGLFDQGAFADQERVYRWRKGVNPDGSGGVPVVPNSRVTSPMPFELEFNGVTADDNDYYALDVIKPCGTETRVGYIVVTNRCRVDVTGDGVKSIDDIFVFINRWFAGCP
jgi:hypothetical protein